MNAHAILKHAMRHLLLSDIHANAVAFKAVLEHAKRRHWDKVVFLGDIIGYYPQAEEATQLLLELSPEPAVLGNHDAMLLELKGLAPASQSVVRSVIDKHRQDLSAASLSFISSFSLQAKTSSFQAVHGALRHPWEYLHGTAQAQANLPYLSGKLCFFGHTHVAGAFVSIDSPKGSLWRTIPFRREMTTYRLPPPAKVFLNPGSVGQPRDGLPLASYGIFDEEAQVVEVFRVPYNIGEVQRLVRQHGYPEPLATRLTGGQ